MDGWILSFFSSTIFSTSSLQEGRTTMGISCTLLCNYVELFWILLDNAPSSIVFYLEMKVDVELGVQDIKSRFTPRR